MIWPIAVYEYALTREKRRRKLIEEFEYLEMLE